MCPTFGARHLQCVLIFLGVTAAMMQRVNLSVAIVAMMDKNAANPNFEEFQWSEVTKSYLLSSFLWGYFVTQIPGSQLAHRFGGKVMLLGCLSLSAILSLVSPLSAHIGGWKLFCALRITQGLLQGSLLSSVHTILSKWVPPEERSLLVTFCYAGLTFGSVVMLLISGWIAASPFGWPGIFYLCGIVSLIWSLVWYFVGASTPSDYKWITTEEISYIERSLLTAVKHEHKPLQTPWLKIFKSFPFWVLLIAQSSGSWGFWMLITQIPSYMKNILGYDIKSNAILSATPYIGNLVTVVIFCILSDFLIRRGYTSINTNRKLFSTIGCWIPVVPIILLGYMSADQSQLAVVLLVIAISANSAFGLAIFTNSIDLSPNFAGTLMGLANSASTIMGFLAPLAVGIIVTDAQNLHQWRIVFFITGAIYFVGNLLFILFGKTNVQSWNNPNQPINNRDNIKFSSI